MSYLSPVLRTTILSSKCALQKNVLHTMPCPVIELGHAEPGTLAIRLRGKLEPRCHVVLIPYEWSHKEQVAVANLGTTEGVEVAESDGWEGHVGCIALIQHGDMVILNVIDNSVTHLHQEHTEGQQE